MYKSIFLVSAVLLSISLVASAEDKPQVERRSEGIALSIYNAEKGRYHNEDNTYGVVREWRKIKLKNGINTIRFRDVAANIRTTTVHFISITDPVNTYVIEQNYEYDLLSEEKLLERFVDKEITLLHEDSKGNVTEEKVILLSAKDLVVKRNNPQSPIEILSHLPRVRLGQLPGGLITKPTLVWSVSSKRAEEHLCEVLYETGGLSWKADYTAVINPDDTALELSAWVTITNNSGKTYNDAEIKLIAGDVRKRPSNIPSSGESSAQKGKVETQHDGFKYKSLFEYKLYTLGRTSTVKDRSNKQIELFKPVAKVPARKIFVYDGYIPYMERYSGPDINRNTTGDPCNKTVEVHLAFDNLKESGLGVPLPLGSFRVFKADSDDGAIEFIGEDRVPHTPRGEEISLKLGNAFDVVGERKQTSFDLKGNTITESFEITLRNHKDEAVTVQVRENLWRRIGNKIISHSVPFKRINYRIVHFNVDVPANGTKKFTFTAQYTW